MVTFIAYMFNFRNLTFIIFHALLCKWDTELDKARKNLLCGGPYNINSQFFYLFFFFIILFIFIKLEAQGYGDKQCLINLIKLFCFGILRGKIQQKGVQKKGFWWMCYIHIPPGLLMSKTFRDQVSFNLCISLSLWWISCFNI